MFSETQKNEILHRGFSIEQIEKQIKRFESGFAPMNIVAPATTDCGIKKFKQDEIAAFAQKYEQAKGQKSIVKFVPASGAASRMFKMLFGLMNEYDGSNESYTKLFDKDGLYSGKMFFNNIEKFAFYESLDESLKKDGQSIQQLLAQKDYTMILEYLLTEKGLNYGNLPKGLLLFHKYKNENRTPLEEHMVEGALYAKDKENTVNIHFTVSPEFLNGFKTKAYAVANSYGACYQTDYNFSFSIQKPTTDTIAVNPDNTPFYNNDGSLLFRPAGHGALIENLNELNYDIIFVKNIDNIVPDDYKTDTVLYKKALAGILLYYQEKLFLYIETLQKNTDTTLTLQEIVDFLQNDIHFGIPDAYTTWNDQEKKTFLLNILNRPIRICGMVKNEGEPGGGPFLVQEKDGSKTLQIIEKAQINTTDAKQNSIFNASTHFNPVDLVCGVKDYKGNKFNLKNYVDEEAGIITSKSKDGKELKALELPGLWNGAMSKWNTIFVEVPSSTFNPVKEVNDLLRKEHQQK